MKRILPLVTGLLLATGVSAQSDSYRPVTTYEKCATMTSLQHRMQQDPGLQQRMENKGHQLRSTVNYDTTGFVIIPVVVHVVYNPANPEQNIPDSLIFSQIEVLNKDYSYTHAGVGTTLPIFDSLTADAGIRFQLATFDPAGNPTTGIERISSTANHSFTFLSNSVKASSSGGADPWPRDHYLNIWVCNMFPVVLGYATFPEDDPALDGLVLGYDYVGERPGAPTAPSNLGRTSTHECGHWFGMRHVWGDGDCSMDDFVQDTPDSDAASSQDCLLSRNDCNDAGNLFWHGTNPPDMVQNFMDYSADACMTMFSRMQIGRMWHKILDHRFELFNSTGCDTPKINGYVITRNITCAGSCDAEATVTVVNGTAPYQYLWDTPGAETTPTVTGLCKGVYTVRVIDADNDTMYIQSFVRTHTNLTATSAVSGASCSTCNDGSVTVTALGGNPDYTYAADGGTPQSSNVVGGLAPGVHTITVTDSCGSQVNFDVTILDVSGVEEHNADASMISVYPNPAQNQVTILIKNEALKNTTKRLVLTDATGRSIIQVETNANQSFTLNLNDLANGLYQLSLVGENGLQITAKKLIVNR